MAASFDPLRIAFKIFDGHVIRAKYDSSSACDGESLLVYFMQNFVPQHCILKGNLLRITMAYHRFMAEEYNGPLVAYRNDVFWKYFVVLSSLVSPYFFLVIPLALINVLIVYRVAKECSGVWYHMAQSLSDIAQLISRLLVTIKVFQVFSPLFAWTSYCQMYAIAMFSALNVFYHVFGVFSLALLTFDRYVSIRDPDSYYIYGSKAQKYLPVAAVISAVPAICISTANILQYSNPLLSDMFFILYSSTWLLCLTISICVSIYCSIRTSKAAKKYQPPASALNAAETIEKMKRFHQLTVRVLLLNVVFTLFMYWICINALLRFICFIPQDVEKLSEFGGFCHDYMKTFESALQLVNWIPAMLLLSSNTGLIFHCMFSRIYRSEVNKLFHEVVGWFRWNNSTPVVPFHE